MVTQLKQAALPLPRARARTMETLLLLVSYLFHTRALWQETVADVFSAVTYIFFRRRCRSGKGSGQRRRRRGRSW